MRKNAKLPKVLGKKVQKARKKTGLSQEAVAFFEQSGRKEKEDFRPQASWSYHAKFRFGS